VTGVLPQVFFFKKILCHSSSTKSNSNSLANQLGIYLILAKREKLPYNSLANQLCKNRNLAKLTSPRAYMRARIVLPSAVPSRWEGEKRNKE
jgi:hypothetical protein